MFEWLVPATFNYLQTGRDMKLSIPFSEPHLFTSMLRILRAVLGIDEAIANQKAQKTAEDKAAGGKGGTATGAAATADSTGATQQADPVQTQVLTSGFVQKFPRHNPTFSSKYKFFLMIKTIYTSL